MDITRLTEDVLAEARRAGLDRVVNEFPEDVMAAADAAAKAREACPAPADPIAEPWPPMRASTTL